MPKPAPRAPIKCKGCGAVGRRRDTCPKCNAVEKPVRAARAEAKAAPPPKPKVKETVATVVVDNGARATAKLLLGQLLSLRTRLDEKIIHVRELAEIL